MTILKPCPFCNLAESIVERYGAGFRVVCWNSGCCDGPVKPSKAEAIAAWNTRVSPWLPIESAPRDGSVIMLSSEGGVWMGQHEPVYTSGFAPKNPWSSLMLNHAHMSVKNMKPTHWQPLPSAPDAKGGK